MLNPLPTEAIRATAQPLSAISPTEGSPVVGPRRALDMITSVLREGGSAAKVPPEIRSNVCALHGHLGRKGVVAENRATDLARMKEASQDLLEGLAKDGTTKLGGAAKRALEAWA